ncbi:MAG: SDR family oxidoreductase [Phycisphaerales bacterium]|jgi:NAD(P)-dependent dehydrogenase (short-subunit alcohol dehydrogenase family)
MTRVALITGGASGIGLATAGLLAARGFHVAISGRSPDKLAAATASLGQACSTFAADLEDPAQAAALVDNVLARHGRLDVIVNNAGWSPSATIPQTTPDIASRVFALNAIAPTVIIARAWPALVKAAADGSSPAVVNVSSMATRDPFPVLFAYAAAKSGVNSLAQSVARQGTPHRIRGFAVAPGSVETDLLRSLVTEAEVPRTRTLTPESVASDIVACIMGERDGDNGTTIFLPSP